MPATPDKVSVLLLSDTHGRLHPEILAMAEDTDLVVHAGDIGDPDVLSALAGCARSIVAVPGNNDLPGRWPESARYQLRRLEPAARVTLPGGTLAVEHGHRVNPVSQRHALLRQKYPDARLILYGHSHRQVIDADSRPWVVNPGAAGRSRTYGGSGCILLHAGQRRWQVTPFQFSLSDWKP